jgi:hypothetical protein
VPLLRSGELVQGRAVTCTTAGQLKGLVSTTVSLANPAFRAVDSKIQAVLVGQARNDQGQTARSRMRTPEGYSLTAATAFDAACRVVAGEINPRLQTPSLRWRRVRGPQPLSGAAPSAAIRSPTSAGASRKRAALRDVADIGFLPGIAGSSASSVEGPQSAVERRSTRLARSTASTSFSAVCSILNRALILAAGTYFHCGGGFASINGGRTCPL